VAAAIACMIGFSKYATVAGGPSRFFVIAARTPIRIASGGQPLVSHA
jgi:hypothetical protein